MLSYLIIGTTYAFAAAVQPGPFQSYLISQSLSKGWQRTLPASIAPLISDGPIIVLVAFILNRVPAGFIIAIQIVGGFFLLYLAARALKRWKRNESDIKEEPHSGRQTIIQATLINLSNPSPYLSWSLILGPILIKGWREDPANGLALLAGFYSIMILLSAVIIILSGSAKEFGTGVTRILILISATALGCFGIYQLWNGINYLNTSFG